MPRIRRDLPPNKKLRAARERLLSPSGSGRPMSTQEVAEAVNFWLWDTYRQQENLTYRDVAALERGDVRWPGERRRKAFRAVLGVSSDAELGFYINRLPRTAPVPTVLGNRVAAGDADTYQAARLETAEEAAVRRRELLRLGGFATASIADVFSESAWTQRDCQAAAVNGWIDSLVGRESPAGNGPRRISSTLVDHIDQRLGHLRHLDDQVGSGELVRLAGSELTLIAQLLNNGSFTEAIGRRLYLLAAEASRQTAWGYFDQDQHRAARRYFELAMRASAEADDPVIGAYALSFMAVQCYSTGHAQRAVSLLQTAETAVARTGTARMRAMLAARTARALSKMGDSKGCSHMLHLAGTALDQGPSEDDPPVLYWVTNAEIDMIAGSCALDLSNSTEAIRRFSAAIAVDETKESDYARSDAIYLMRAAEAHIRIGDLDGAVRWAQEAQRRVRGVDSARAESTLTCLRAELAAYASNRDVREFLEETA